MPEYLWTARLETAATARNVSLTSPQTLAGDGSDRRYYRLLGSPTVVLLFHPFPPGGEVNENDSYYLVGRHLRAHGVPVPEIYVLEHESGINAFAAGYSTADAAVASSRNLKVTKIAPSTPTAGQDTVFTMPFVPGAPGAVATSPARSRSITRQSESAARSCSVRGQQPSPATGAAPSHRPSLKQRPSSHEV